MKKQMIFALTTCAVLGATATGAYASTTDTCASIDKTTMESVMEKQRAGTVLTNEETTLLQTAKTCFEKNGKQRSGSGIQAPPGGFGSGMTMSGSHMSPRDFGSGETLSGSHMGPEDGSGSIHQSNDKKEYRAKISDTYANTIDGLVTKYMKSIDSKTSTEKLTSIDAFLTRLSTMSTKIESSSYSQSVKEEYTNILEYLRTSFEEQRTSIETDNTDTTITNIIDVLS